MDYVVFKLVTGEQILATILDQTRNSIIVKDAIVMKHIPVVGRDGSMTERLVTTKYCHYTDDTEFEFDLNFIIYVKPLREGLINHYKGIIQDFNQEDGLLMDDQQEEFNDINYKNIIH